MDGTPDAIVGVPYAEGGGIKRGSLRFLDDGGTSYSDVVNRTRDGESLGLSLRVEKSNDALYIVAARSPYWDDNAAANRDSGRVMAVIPEFEMAILPVLAVFLPPILLRKRVRSPSRQ